MLALSYALLGMMLAAGCGTVTPKLVTSSGPSWDGSALNSGTIGFVTNGTVLYIEVTPHWRDRYNAMIATYGGRFKPALTPDYGLTRLSTNSLVTPEAYRKFCQMNRWRKGEESK